MKAKKIQNASAVVGHADRRSWIRLVAGLALMPIAVANAQIPQPVKTHPRLWITQTDVPRLQSWATSANPVYKNGMQPLLKSALTQYNSAFTAAGVAKSPYPDLGDTQGYQGMISEEVGFVLAFNSLIDPNATNRVNYAKDARNLLMHAMNEAAKGPLANAPFRDPQFSVYNRANAVSAQWPLMVDWLYSQVDGQGQPILTSADKATIRKVFLQWANRCMNASTTGGDHPEPIGVINNHSLLPNNKPYRMASNNYYLGHERLVTMMGLCIDPVDDPKVDNSKPDSAIGNTLRSMILEGNGAWLYQTNAMMGEPKTVANDYGYTGNGAGFGIASGGMPPEGMLYGHSFGFVLGDLLALQTAGFNNTALSGPQVKLANSPVWDRYVTGLLTSITPTAKVAPSETYLGPVFQFACFGDVLRLYTTPDFMEPISLLAILEQAQGKTTHLAAARWFATNAVQGTVQENSSNPWTWGTAMSILYYLLLDPKATAAPDPRPSLPLNYFDPAAGRVVAHNTWGPTSTMFDYRASWTSINHQDGDGGQFELFRNGEWLTKEMSNYDNNLVGFTPTYHNSLGIQNWCKNGTPPLSWDEPGIWTNGGQWMWGSNAGDPTTVTSNGPGYTYADSDLTNLYNRPDFWTPANGAVDVKQATRSIVWLNSDYVIVYDRAQTGHSGLFKTFNLSLVTNPTIKGNVATEALSSGQSLFIQTLLPRTPSMTAFNGAAKLNPHAELDPTQFVLTIKDKSNPAIMRFLHVLQGANSGAAMVPAIHVISTKGTGFDGAAFGNSAVFFPYTAKAAISTTTFTVPGGVHNLVLTGLAANGMYDLSTTTVSGTTTIILTPNGTKHMADTAGVLTVAI